MAAALFESLLVNHPFTDRNKRVAFFGTDTFLRMNGWCLKTKSRDGYDTIIAALEGKSRPFEVLLPWIRRCLEAL
jgi:death-on-curing protein